MPKAKPLYLAKNTEGLNKLADVSRKHRTIKASITTADKLYVNAKDAQLNGDEEKAYVLYMRYYHVLSGVWRDSAYKAKKSVYDRQIGLDRPRKAVAAAELLLDSLEKRYEDKLNKDDLNAQTKKQRIDKKVTTDTRDDSNGKDDGEDEEYMFDSDSSLPEIPDVPTTPIEKRKFAAEQIFQNNTEDPLIPVSGSGSNSVASNAEWFGNHSLLDISDSKTVNAGAAMPSISGMALYEELQLKPDDMIVLDCRPRYQQSASHVDHKRFPQWIEIPEEAITAGVTGDSLSKLMDKRRQQLWSNRTNKQIVLVDSDSKSSHIAGMASLPVVILKDAIYKFDLAHELSHEPLLLDGGYLRWYQTYSPYCIGKVVGKVSQQQFNDVPKQVSFDYPELPKEEPSMFSDASSFDATPSGYPTSAVVGSSAINSTYHQPTNLTSPGNPNPNFVNGAVVNSDHGGLFYDRIVPQVNTLPHASGPISADHVVANVNTNFVGYGDVPSGLPVGPASTELGPVTFPIQHPAGGGHTNSTVPLYNQVAPVLLPPSVSSSQPPQSDFFQGPFLQEDMNRLHPYHQHQTIPISDMNSQNTGTYFQHNVTSQGLHPQQDTGLYLPHQSTGPYPEQSAPSSGPHFHPAMATTGPHPHQDTTMLTAQQNVIEPVPYPHHMHNASMHPQQQEMSQALPQGNVQLDMQQEQFRVAGWDQNPRVARGPIPAPPTYEDARMIPSHPPVQPPLPPPVSIPPHVSETHHIASVVHANPFPDPGHSNWPLHQQQEPIVVVGAKGTHPIEPVPPTLPRPAQVAVENHPQLFHPVAIVNEGHMVVPQNHFSAQVDSRRNQVVHHPFVQPTTPQHHDDSVRKLNQLNAERQAALEKERQERLWLESRKEELRNQQEELKAMISRSNATEQQVMDWKQQLLDKERDLAAKEIEQQAALQDRLKLQEQREKEISDIEQKLNQQKEALQRQKAEQEMEMIKQHEIIEQQRLAALSEVQREKESIQQQQKELRERQQNMNEQMAQWLQMRGANDNSRQVQVATGLPVGWEKKMDPTTGRFYYQDHSTKTTHWNPPSNWLPSSNNMPPGQRIPPQPAQPSQQPVPTSSNTPQPSSLGGGSNASATPASTTVPVQPPAGVAKPKPTSPPQGGGSSNVPVTGPPAKVVSNPRPAVVPDRSTKPQQRHLSHDNAPVKQIPPHIWKQKMENLQPVHGGSLGPGLTGMKNFGNTCFMNSIIQCLCSTVPLVVHFLTGKYRYDLNKNNPIGTGGRIAEEFNVIVRAAWYGRYRSITPRDFKNTVAKFAPRFITSEQQDAQEFLAFVTDGIHEDLNRVRVHSYIGEQNNDGIPHHIAAQRAWDHHQKRNDSIIIDLFQGQFRSVVTCLTCKKQSVTFEAFMYLTVPIPKGINRPTVEDCIQLFSRPEKIEGGDRWLCPNCKCRRDAIKKIEIWKLPPVLMIVLKRFLYHGQWRDKISTYVHYPVHELNMSPYVVSNQKPNNYHLYAITNHTGTLHGGHYTACCRYPYNRNKFHKFDDQDVYEIGSNKLQTAAGYVLFYSSIDFTPPKLGT